MPLVSPTGTISGPCCAATIECGCSALVISIMNRQRFTRKYWLSTHRPPGSSSIRTRSDWKWMIWPGVIASWNVTRTEHCRLGWFGCLGRKFVRLGIQVDHDRCGRFSYRREPSLVAERVVFGDFAAVIRSIREFCLRAPHQPSVRHCFPGGVVDGPHRSSRSRISRCQGRG